MAITVGNTSSLITSSTTHGTTISWTHNNDAGDNNCVVVAIGHLTLGGSISSVTYDGNTMTLAASKTNSGDCVSSIYYIEDQADGNATVLVTFDSSQDERFKSGAAITLNGVSPGDVIGQTSDTEAESATSVSGSITANKSSSLIVQHATTAALSAVAISPDNSQTTAEYTYRPANELFYIDATGSSQTLGASAGSSEKWASVIVEIQTTAPPTLSATTSGVRFSTTSDVTCNVTDEGDETVTERGFVYATTSNPTTSDTKAVVSGTTGEYTTTLTGLTGGTTYYVRGFATSSVGTSYGTEVSFTTDENQTSYSVILTNPITFS